jgi:hypothetical protein
MTSLRRAVLFCSILTILPRFAAGQSCTPGGIKNFHGTTNTTSYTISWDVPAGAPVGAMYEVMQATAGDYCQFPSSSAAYTVITTTTATTYTAQKTISEMAYFVFVRLQSDHCVATDFTLVTDSFATPPSKPVIASAVVSGSTVTVTFNHNDPHVDFIALYRAGSDGNFTFLDEKINPCDGSQPAAVDSNVAPGTYQYKLVAFNDGNSTGLAGVQSDPVTVVVGGATPLQIVSFAAAPPTVRAGQPVTLSWVTQGASSVVIDQGVGAESPAGTATVTPSNTTTYTLTAMSGASTVTSTVTVTVLTVPVVVVSSFPSALLQVAGSGGATTRYTLTNAGGTSTAINLSQNGNFFTQSPPSFTLASGASQVVTVTGVAEPAGPLQGTANPSGAGVTSGLQVPIKLLSAAPPNGTVTAQPAKNRVDVTSPSGTIDFTNNGDATLTGIVTSDVPWLIPQSGVVTIPPHSTVTISFTIDRTQRPDSAALIGSAAGNLSLVYLGTGPAKVGRNDTTTPSVSLVTVVDTVQLSVSTAAPPALAAGEVALFIPGAGHIVGSVGTFISDLSVLNPLGNRPIPDLRFFYTPINTALASSQSASVASVPSNVSVALADVTKNVFGSEGTVGSLQLRSSLADKLGISTNVFNSTNPAGTYGTAIPTFRSDRAAGQGENVYLTGLQQDGSNSHTNLFIQETAGVGVTVQTEFLNSDGTSLGTRSDTASAFGLAIISSGVVPQGTISVIMTNTSTSGGKFLAYATPVDNKSGDNWDIVDWPRQYAYSASEPMVIPIAGAAQGASAFFRTDAAVMNTGGTTGSVQVQYISNAAPLTTTISLGTKQTNVLNNVTQTLFGNSAPALGYLIFTPVNSTFAITSRTYATDPAHPEKGTYGSSTPTLAVSIALKNGSLRALGSLEDTTSAAVVTKRPATFHTNFGLAEVTGNSVTVRVTLRFTYPAGSKVQGIGTASKDYVLSANGFSPPRSLVTDILGSGRDAVGDLRGLEADFQVVAGTGAVMVYTSSVDNGTNDSILRTD